MSFNKPPSSQPDIEEKRREENKDLSSPDGAEEIRKAKSFPSSLPGIQDAQLIDVYRRYPRREDRADALRAISKAIGLVSTRDAVSKETARQWLMARVEAFSELVRVEGREKRFIKLPATWFNNASYDNEDLQPKPKPKSVEELCDIGGFDDPKNQWQPLESVVAHA